MPSSSSWDTDSPPQCLLEAAGLAERQTEESTTDCRRASKKNLSIACQSYKTRAADLTSVCSRVDEQSLTTTTVGSCLTDLYSGEIRSGRVPTKATLGRSFWDCCMVRDFFKGRMPFLTPNQHRRRLRGSLTEDKRESMIRLITDNHGSSSREAQLTRHIIYDRLPD